MNLHKNINIFLLTILMLLSMGNYSFAQDRLSTTSSSSELNNGEKAFWQSQREISNDEKLDLYKDLGCWECVLISNFFDSVGSVFIFLYEKIAFALRPFLFLFFLYWLINEYRKKSMSVTFDGGGAFMDNKGDMKELITMMIKIMIAFVFLSIPSTTLFKYTVSPMVNLASALGSVSLNKIDDEVFLDKDNGLFLDMHTERQKSRQQEVHDLIHTDVLSAEKQDSTVSQETNTLIPEGAKRELLYLTERFSETYSYGFKLGFKIGVSAGLAFLKFEGYNLLMKEVVLKRIVPKLTGPLAPIIRIVVEASIIVYDKVRAGLKFIYMKIIAFGWFILGIFFMMSFKFLFAMLNVVMEFSIAALLVPFAIITYPFKGVLGIGDFQSGIEKRFISNSCYLFMICIVSSFIYFIFSHFLQTPYEYKGDIRTLKSILDEVLYGNALTSTWGYISSFMLFFWNNLDIMFIMAGIGLIGSRLIEQTASLTGTYLTSVNTSYESKFLSMFFTAGKKAFTGVKTGFINVKKAYAGAKVSFEEAESTENIEGVVEAYNVQNQINDLQTNIDNRINNADPEVRTVMEEIVAADQNEEGNSNDEEGILSLSDDAQDAYINSAINRVDEENQTNFESQVLNDERTADFSPNQKSTLSSMVSTGDINKVKTLYSSPEEISSDHHFQEKVKEEYVNKQLSDKSNIHSKSEIENKYKIDKNKSESSVSKDAKIIEKELIKEDKSNIEKIYAEHKAKELIKEEGFKNILKETSLGKNGKIEDEDWIKDRAVDIIRVARNKDGGKEYLSNNFTSIKKERLQKEFKEIFELQKELKSLKGDKNLKKQCKRLGVDEINNKIVIDEIYDAEGAILSQAKNKYKERLEFYGKGNLPKKEQDDIKQLDLLIKSNERKIKKKKRISKKEEFSILDNDEENIYSQENVEKEFDEVEKLLKQLGLIEEYSMFKRQKKRSDKKSSDESDEYDKEI